MKIFKILSKVPNILFIKFKFTFNLFRYPCNICGFETPRKDRLKQHIQSIHEKIREEINNK